MRDIRITVTNRVATVPDDAKIHCGNSDYTLTFDFDEEWAAEKTKTVRFVWHIKGRTYHKDIVLEGNTLNVPVFINAYAVFVGVYAGDLKATTAVKIPCVPSILCCDGHDELIDSGVFARMQSQIKTLLAESASKEDVEKIIEMLNEVSTATIGTVALLANKWVGNGNLYSQKVTIAGVTENSQVDLTPSVEQLAVFYEKDLTFVTENEGGVVTVYAIGQKPENDYEMQVTITEVSV